jgi:hypothetical protein
MKRRPPSQFEKDCHRGTETRSKAERRATTHRLKMRYRPARRSGYRSVSTKKPPEANQYPRGKNRPPRAALSEQAERRPKETGGCWIKSRVTSNQSEQRVNVEIDPGRSHQASQQTYEKRERSTDQ